MQESLEAVTHTNFFEKWVNHTRSRTEKGTGKEFGFETVELSSQSIKERFESTIVRMQH